MVYCFYKDAVGLVVCFLVYLMVISGNLVFTVHIVYPALTKMAPYDDVENYQAKRVAIVIEWVFYEICSVFMVWSHLGTMCKDPGFIPKGYRYDASKLPTEFKRIYEQS